MDLVFDRPVFANSAAVSSPERLVVRGGKWKGIELRVRYGLVLSERHGVILIDTGYTEHLWQSDRSLLKLYRKLLAPKLHIEAQPEPFLAAFGFRPSDVNFVVVTHFHADHISGLSMFPKARFVASGRAWEAIQSNSPSQNARHGIFTDLLPSDFAERIDPIEAKRWSTPEKWWAGAQSYDLFSDGSILSIDLPGHADGHFGLLFPKLQTPLLYAADTQWMTEGLHLQGRPGFPSTLFADDPAAIGRSSDLVLQARKQGYDIVLCHDPVRTDYDWDPRLDRRQRSPTNPSQ